MTNQSDQLDSLIDGFQEQLRLEWQLYRKQSYNANTKGQVYEEAFARLLREYFGSLYDIQTRCAVVDDKLKFGRVFDDQENEMDVIATYQQSRPRLVFRAGGMKWVPLSGVAFVCEIASNLKTGKLRDDLGKMGKIRELTVDDSDRFEGMLFGDTELMVDHQPLCLVYDTAAPINTDTMTEILQQNRDNWDILLLVDDDQLILNPDIPMGKKAHSIRGMGNDIPHEIHNAVEWIHDQRNFSNGLRILDHGLLQFIVLISIVIPQAPVVDAATPLVNMIHSIWEKDVLRYIEKRLAQINEGNVENPEETIESLEMLFEVMFGERVQAFDSNE